jgi:hypothetical protein
VLQDIVSDPTMMRTLKEIATLSPDKMTKRYHTDPNLRQAIDKLAAALQGRIDQGRIDP